MAGEQVSRVANRQGNTFGAFIELVCALEDADLPYNGRKSGHPGRVSKLAASERVFAPRLQRCLARYSLGSVPRRKARRYGEPLDHQGRICHFRNGGQPNVRETIEYLG